MLCFSLLFSVQILPVEEVAAFIYGTSIIEELPHGQDGPQSKESESGSKFLYHPGLDRLSIVEDLSSLMGYLRIYDEEISSRCADDVSTPPPNVSC